MQKEGKKPHSSKHEMGGPTNALSEIYTQAYYTPTNLY